MPNALLPPPGAAAQRRMAFLLIVCCAVIISFDGPLLRGMEAASAWQVNFYRAVALFAFAAVTVALRFGKDAAAAVGGIGLRGCAAGALFGLSTVTFVQSMALTTVANTLFILGAIPFFAALLARIFLKEKLGRATLATMGVAALGLGVMVAEGVAAGAGAGNALALLTAWLFASYTVILRGSRHREMLPALLVAATVILVVTAPVLGGRGGFGVSMRDLALCLFWGGALSGCAHWLFIIASRHLAAAEITLFLLLELALGPLFVWLLFAEMPSAWTLAGGALIVCAVAARAAVELRGGRSLSVPSPSTRSPSSSPSPPSPSPSSPSPSSPSPSPRSPSPSSPS